MRIVEAHTPEWLDRARAIFREYGASIENVAGCSLQYQGFERELTALPGKYSPPKGGIYLAVSERDEVVGCIAFRPIPEVGDRTCELKRMYVVPGARGIGLGRLLAHRVIDAARGTGYGVMKLDTSSTMIAAQALYTSLGFVPCEAYNADPEPGTLWFAKTL